MPNETVFADGSFDFAGGVNTQTVTTVRSALVPHGTRRDQLPWLSNGTVRNGTISPRNGWSKLLDLLPTGLWQVGWMYEPIDVTVGTGNPYIVALISGRVYKALLEPPFTVTDLSAVFGLTMPATVAQGFMVEAEGILCIQSGDGLTLPLFYRSKFGAAPETLRRSNGITGSITYPNINEIPAAGPMVYYSGRLWYAQGRIYTAGDIVGNTTSGTAPYNFRDSVFKVTENPLATGGDGFTVPSEAGDIRALAYTANLDTSLGQGPLYIFTRKQIYQAVIPVTRADWISAGKATNVSPNFGPDGQPLQTVAQIDNGAVGEDGIVHVNGDLFYQSIDPAIRSLTVATRYFGQWGNVPLSRNVQRALKFNDRSVLRRASGINFDNRLLEGCLPKQTASGIITPGIIPLNFDTISTMEEREPPAWEGMWEGADFLKTFKGDYGGLPRAFGVVVSRLDQSLDIWEFSDSARTDNDGKDLDKRITWYAEFPAFEWNQMFRLKKLRGLELWIDQVSGTVDMTFYYRPDADQCFHLWHDVSFCAARNCAEDVNTPICYPIGPSFCDGFVFPITLPEPPAAESKLNARPTNIGFQFQPKVVITGWCRIRGIIMWAEFKEKSIYENISRTSSPATIAAP